MILDLLNVFEGAVFQKVPDPKKNHPAEKNRSSFDLIRHIGVLH